MIAEIRRLHYLRIVDGSGNSHTPLSCSLQLEKCPKAAFSADLNPELEILIDTKAYNEVKVIIRIVYGFLARFECRTGTLAG
jgi:hypothetical protein